MAEFLSSPYLQLLQNISEFLENVNQLTKENEDILTTLKEMYEMLSGMALENDDGETEGDTAEAKKFKNIAQKLFQNVLFGCYLRLITTFSDRSSLVSEMENAQKEDKSSKLPVAIQQRIDDINHYLKKANECMKEIDKMLPPLFQKVKDARRKKFRVPEEEVTDLEMDAEDIERELEKCENYLKDANKTINLLESDISDEKTRFNIRIVQKVAGVAGGILIGGALFSSTELGKSSVQHLGSKLTGLLGISGIALASTCLFLRFYLVIDSHNSLLNDQLNKVKSELKKATREYEERQSDFKVKVTQRMKR